MLSVYGHIREQIESTNHTKVIVGGNYYNGIDFEVELDVISINQDAMTIEKSKNLITDAVNKKYRTDFVRSNTLISPLKIKKSSADLIKSVDDEILSYQYDEAGRLLNLDFFLGSSCVFGVALERVCLLICERNKKEFTNDITELGRLSKFLDNNNLVSKSDLHRLSATSKFRNLSSHTNGKALKTDAEQIKSTIDYFVNTYL